MKEFIELIKSIGFIEIDTSYENGYNTLNWTYNGYRISITTHNVRRGKSPGYENIWWRLNDKYIVGGILGFEILGVIQTSFFLDQIGLLEKHFKPELRELKLKELGL